MHSKLLQTFAAESHFLDDSPATSIIVQQNSPRAEGFANTSFSVRRHVMINDLLLPPVDPSGEAGQRKHPGLDQKQESWDVHNKGDLSSRFNSPGNRPLAVKSGRSRSSTDLDKRVKVVPADVTSDALVQPRTSRAARPRTGFLTT